MIIIIIIAFTIITSSSSSSSSSIISSGWDVVGPHAPPGLPPRTWGAHEQHSLTSSGQELQKARGGPLVAPSALAASAVPKPPAKTSEKALAKQVEFVFGNPGGLCRPEIVSRWLWIEIKAPETGFAKLRPGTQRHACCVLKLRSSCTYSVCVCVSHPGQRVFHHHPSTSRGPAHDITTLANEASDVMGCGQRRLTVYLLKNC